VYQYGTILFILEEIHSIILTIRKKEEPTGGDRIKKCWGISYKSSIFRGILYDLDWHEKA
jgi:hypothetical protein